MPADTFDSILGLIEMGTGNNNNNWGAIFNNQFAAIAARGIAGAITRGNTGGALDLSGSPPPAGARQDIDAIQIFNGALASDLTVTVPNLSKSWFIVNSTTGAFSLYWKTAGGTATQIPQGTMKIVVCDGNNNMIRADKEEIGAFRISGKAAAGPGELACNGASLLRATYPDLFNAISTTFGAVDGTHFTLPLLTDTNRYLRAAGGAVTVGTYQSSQNKAHTHTGSGATTGASQFHTHTGSGNTGAMSANASHSHTSNGVANTNPSGSNSGGATWPQNFAAETINATNTDHTPSYSFTTSGDSVDHYHNYSFTTSGGSADGTEARPESMAALICIRY